MISHQSIWKIDLSYICFLNIKLKQVDHKKDVKNK